MNVPVMAFDGSVLGNSIFMDATSADTEWIEKRHAVYPKYFFPHPKNYRCIVTAFIKDQLLLCQSQENHNWNSFCM